MFEQEIQRKVADFREIGFPDYVPRERRVHVADRTVSTIVGARRAGKSFRAIQVADELRKQGVVVDEAGIRDLNAQSGGYGTGNQSE